MKMWICRDRDGLCLFFTKPKKYYFNPCNDNDYWWGTDNNGNSKELDPSLFPEVTFENSPMEVELKLASNENN